MNTNELTFALGGGAFGLEDEFMADIVVAGLDKGIIACQAASEPVAKSLRDFVMDRLAPRIPCLIGDLIEVVTTGNVAEVNALAHAHNDAVNDLRARFGLSGGKAAVDPRDDRIRELEAKLAAVRSSSSVCDRIDQLEAENASLREENAVLVREEERQDEVIARIADLLKVPKALCSRTHDLEFWLDSPPTGEDLISQLQAEVAALKQQCHDHDRRRDASMNLARTLAEQPDAAPNWDLHGYHEPGSMDPGCSTIGIDSEGGSHD